MPRNGREPAPRPLGFLRFLTLRAPEGMQRDITSETERPMDTPASDCDQISIAGGTFKDT